MDIKLIQVSVDITASGYVEALETSINTAISGLGPGAWFAVNIEKKHSSANKEAYVVWLQDFTAFEEA